MNSKFENYLPLNDTCEQILNCEFRLYADHFQLVTVELGQDVETARAGTRDCNTGRPVTGNAGKLAKIANKIYRFTEGEIAVFSVKN
jgi:hypothetical protein